MTAGSPEPMGVVPTATGLNIAVFSEHAEAIEFCLFDAEDEREIARLPLPSRLGGVFFGHVEGLGVGARYGLRAHGPWNPGQGDRFNPAKLLVDPYARALDRPFVLDPSLFDARRTGAAADAVDSAASVPKAIVTAPAPLPDLPPPPDWERLVLYEIHVRGFSKRNPDVPEPIRGTFAGLAHPASIRHLQRLGVTAVEILPAMAWLDERHLPPLGLSNYWGYNPVAFCAPDPRLAPGGFAEIRAAVDALHAAGIAVILDVVLNHSAESDHLGPTVSMRGLDNRSYYRLLPGQAGLYVNDAGCGNVLATENPAMLRLAVDALRLWVAETGMDGFRFDLATTIARRADGFDPAAPLLSAIDQDPLLSGRIRIAEPWDIGPGGYQLGGFPAPWGEWNDRYRDTLRRFFRGGAGLVPMLASSLAGSADIFAWRRRPVSRSINFVTAHDGFTLADLVSHARKENRANGEDNRDGTDDNSSWNNGVEGATTDPEILARRRADVRALLAALLVSRGTPMLSMGDEIGRSQGGNNNAYAQDNAIAWMDWQGADTALLAFTADLVALRLAHPLLHDERPLTGQPVDGLDDPDIAWFTAEGGLLEGDAWNDASRRTLVAVLAGRDAAGVPERICVVLQGGGGEGLVQLPPVKAGRAWHWRVDTGVRPQSGATAGCLAIAARTVWVFEEGAK